jgi:5-methylcytosine-specific restriction protein A
MNRGVREIVKTRAMGRCEICGLRAYLFHLHHRKPRAMGGTSLKASGGPQNLLNLCPPDHLGMVEIEREKSLHNGWLVLQSGDPGAVPVKLWDGWYYLTPDGARVPLISMNREAERDRLDQASGVR